MLGPEVRLGEQLIAEGLITAEQLTDALSRQNTSGQRIGSALVELGALSNNALVDTLAKRLGVRGCVLRHGLIDPKVAKCIEKDEAEHLRVLPMFRVHDEITVAMTEPQSIPTLDRLQSLTGCRIRPVLVLEENITEYQRKYLASEVTVDSFLASIEESDVTITETEAIDEGPVTDLDKMVDGSPVVNLVNLAILTAVRDGASDVHIEPNRDSTSIRYRVDGQLRKLLTPPRGMHASIVSRVKVIGRMDIAEKRLPQEGRIHLVADGREIDLRVSSMPTVLGEKIVLRVLDKSNLTFDLPRLGVQDEDMVAINSMLRSPYGMMLVTGPTGSGKTTTLYSGLELLRSDSVNVVTVEDPVEYQLAGINQIQVNTEVGMTFARALRSVLRQDPDIIMVGEIRDEDTARVAVQAALTGHMVLSTLHTNDCPGGDQPDDRHGHRALPDRLGHARDSSPSASPARICPSCQHVVLSFAGELLDIGWLGSTAATSSFNGAKGAASVTTPGFAGASVSTR
jgi:type IV pilus assembly protein PilB